MYHKNFMLNMTACLFSFLASSPAISLSCTWAARLMSDKFTRCHTETEWGDHDFCLSSSHCADTDPAIGSGRLERGLNPWPPDQEPCALPTELSLPRWTWDKGKDTKKTTTIVSSHTNTLVTKGVVLAQAIFNTGVF